MKFSFVINGALAQLVERLAGSEEVRGSTPLGSTNLIKVLNSFELIAVKFVKYLCYFFSHNRKADLTKL